MPHYAVSSFVPGSPPHDFGWPDRGPAERADVRRGVPASAEFGVLALPCRHPGKLHWQSFARWVVLTVEEADFAEQDGILDFRRGTVLFNGPPRAACAFLREHGLPVPSSLDVRVGGDWQDATAGDSGVAIAGWDAVAHAGRGGLAYAEYGRASAGDQGVAVSPFADVTAGDRGFAVTTYGTRATAGVGGLARTDEGGTARAGDFGVAITEAGGTAVAGSGGLAVAYGSGRAAAGPDGVALAFDAAGYDGTVQAAAGGALLVRWHDGTRYRVAVAYAGEGGIKPHTPYKLDEQGRFVEAAEAVRGAEALEDGEPPVSPP